MKKERGFATKADPLHFTNTIKTLAKVRKLHNKNYNDKDGVKNTSSENYLHCILSFNVLFVLLRRFERKNPMKRFLVALLCLPLMIACGGNKTAGSDETAPADSTDSIAADSADKAVSEEDSLLANLPMPKAADELFDDFIFNFAANKKLQLERILFPLKKVNGDKVETIERSQWRMERYFMRQQYYTLLFDSERQMEVVKDTSLNHAVVEMIYFNTGAVVQHIFDRMRGAWMLTSINTIPISKSSNATFLEFYHHFSADPEFQMQSLNETISFEGPDPDDDFARMEGVISPDTWEAFAPELPTKMIFNIIYGTPHKEGNRKLFLLRGIANGQELEMTFQRKEGKWKLTKLTT